MKWSFTFLSLCLLFGHCFYLCSASFTASISNNYYWQNCSSFALTKVWVSIWEFSIISFCFFFIQSEYRRFGNTFLFPLFCFIFCFFDVQRWQSNLCECPLGFLCFRQTIQTQRHQLREFFSFCIFCYVRYRSVFSPTKALSKPQKFFLSHFVLLHSKWKKLFFVSLNDETKIKRFFF